MSYEEFPGGDLIDKGLADLEAGRETVEALLVSIGALRLLLAGIPVPDETSPNPERRLYDRLALEDSDSAHSRYNALVRRLVSFESTVEILNSAAEDGPAVAH